MRARVLTSISHDLKNGRRRIKMAVQRYSSSRRRMTARKRNKNHDYRPLANDYARLADEFLQAYFMLGLSNARLNVGYFVMAHCLERRRHCRRLDRYWPLRSTKFWNRRFRQNSPRSCEIRRVPSQPDRDHGQRSRAG